MRWIVACWLALCVGLLPVQPVRAAEPVDLALVLLSDVSRSISPTEFQLQKRGYHAAFTDPRVTSAIRSGVRGAIAVAYIEFADADQVTTVVPWTVLRDAASAAAFAARVRDAPRSASGRTAIGAGITQAMKELEAWGGGEDLRRVIDVCGDGTSNAGDMVGDARDAAVKAGVIVNGLTMINDQPTSWNYMHVHPDGGLDNYYREHVTGGQGSFVLTVHDYADFGDAITRKLLQEIASR